MADGMAEAVTQSGLVWKRAAESLLRAVGGSEIRLLLRGAAASDENARELGMGGSEIRQISVSPAVVNWLANKPGERRRAEVFIASGSLEGALDATGISSGKELLESALGLRIGDFQLKIAALQVGAAGGTDFLYTITAVI